MGDFKLFDFQEEAVQVCLDLIKQKNPVPSICVAPVAYGKSGVLSEVVRRSGAKAVVLQPSAELLKQNIGKLRALGGDATIYSASLKTKELSDITYATLGSIKDMGADFRAQGITLVIVDEADRGFPPDKDSMFMTFIKALKPHCVIGFTATPITLTNTMEGSMLKMMMKTRPSYFKDICYTMQVSEIIEKDRWTPIKYKAYEFDENMLILNSSGSDFSEESIKKYNEAKGINNKIFLEIRELLLDPLERILTFCDSIESAQLFADNTKDSAAVHGGMSKNEREKVLTAFQKGEIRAVFNHSVLGIGYDHPALRTVIMGRPTNSFSIYYQYLGRGVRKCPGKKEFKFVDYGGNVKRFGTVESITVEKHPIVGWAMFSNDRLLTGTSMKGAPVYKKDLVPKNELPKGEGGNYTINIGKFKGQPLSKVKRSYLEYMIFTSGFDFSRGAMKEFYEKTNRYLESTKMQFVK